MSKKSASKKAASKKAASKKAASKKAASKKTANILLTPCGQAVYGCIAAQTGGAIITPNATLGGLGVNSFVLAGCINSKLGTSYTAADFPPTMTVRQCLVFVC